jgi:hypothetical protein
VANFSNLATEKNEKKRLANPTKGFWGIFFKRSPYIEEKQKNKS